MKRNKSANTNNLSVVNERRDEKAIPTVLSRLAALQTMDIANLRTLWLDLYKSESAKHSTRDYLIKRLSYRIQELAYGGDTRETEARLAMYAKRYCGGSSGNGGSNKWSSNGKYNGGVALPGAGSVLVRQYHGVEHQVMVLEEGAFQYNGCKFGSLSAIAKHITGMSWSGFAFFNLKQRI